MKLIQDKIYIYKDKDTEIDVIFVGIIKWPNLQGQLKYSYAFESINLFSRHEIFKLIRLMLDKNELHKHIFKESANQIINSFYEFKTK